MRDCKRTSLGARSCVAISLRAASRRASSGFGGKGSNALMSDSTAMIWLRGPCRKAVLKVMGTGAAIACDTDSCWENCTGGTAEDCMPQIRPQSGARRNLDYITLVKVQEASNQQC